jgi:hypothetical protein
MATLEETKKSYKSILRLLKKHDDVTVFDLDDFKRKSEVHLHGLTLKETYGFDLDPIRIDSTDWIRFGDNMTLYRFSPDNGRSISWPDCGNQPVDELLLCISFPTGPYIFGEDYPTEYFQKFWNELRTYNPKFIDSHNSGLYFSMDNAGKIFNEYTSIFNRYREENKEDVKQRKIIKMKEELAKLEGNS